MEEHAHPATVVRGQIAIDDGRPAAGVRVEAFRFEDGRPGAESAAAGTLDREGRFELRLPEVGEHVLAVLAPGRRPLTLRASAGVAHAAGEIDLGAHRLERGHAIEGEARRLGRAEPGLGVAAAVVSLPGLDVDVTRTMPPGMRAEWTDGRFEWSSLVARAGPDGRFKLGGLAEAVYRLHVTDRPGTLGALRREPAYREVTAPDMAVALDLDASLVTLELEGARRGAPGRLRVRIADELESSFDFGDGGRPLTLLAPPRVELEVAVELDGRSGAPIALLSPGPGEELRHTVRLVP